LRAFAAVAVGIAGSLALPAAVAHAAVAGAALTHAAPKPAAEPALAAPVLEPVLEPVLAPVGWRPLFATDFSGTDLPAECESYESPQGGPAASYYRPDEVAVAGGLPHLNMRRRDVDGRPFTTGGIGCRAVAQAYLTNQHGSGSSQVTVAGRHSDDFHTYTIEWSPSFFRVLIDGTIRMTDAHGSARDEWMGFAMSSGDRLTGVPDATTQLPAEFQVDALRVYAYDPQANPIDDAPQAAGPGTALVLLIFWYARLRDRRRLRPAHRA
jgi:hypothetical protein